MAFYNYTLAYYDLTQTSPSVWSLTRARLQALITWAARYGGITVNGGNNAQVYNLSQKERDKVRFNDTGATGVDKLVFTPDITGIKPADLPKARFSLTMFADDIGLEEITLASGAWSGVDFNGSALKAGIKVTAGNAADVLIGSAFDDQLYGAGASTLKGGKGNDTYVVAGADVITEAANEGIDTVQVTSSWVLADNIENLTLLGTNAINGTGNSSANSITGNSAANALSGGAGNDTLDGGAGNDTLDGGTGNDSLIGGIGDDAYIVDSSGDEVIESSGAGLDTVRSSLSWTLGANLENLILNGTGNINGTGNDAANLLIGNAANNTLLGQGGNDRIIGGPGIDRLTGGAGADVFEFAAGDALIGPGINAFETITDFEAGIDIIDLEGETLRTINVAWSQRRSLATDFSAAHFADQFYRTDSLLPGGACAVILDTASKPRTFLVIDGNNDGFDLLDNVIEITGYSGSLSFITII